MSKEDLLGEVLALREELHDRGQRDTVQDLALSEARYRALIEGSSDFIYVLDSDGNFTFANAEIGNLLGYNPTEIIGRHYSEILHPMDAETVGRAFHERRTGERAARRVEVRLRSRAGDTREVEMDVRHFSISASGLYKGSDFVGTHGVARDITERKYHESRRTVLQQVRETVWSMVGADDITKVLESIRVGLEKMTVLFAHCAVNVVELTEPAMLHSYSSYGSSGISKQGEWMIADTQSHAALVANTWRSSELLYRRDLESDDPHGERDRIIELFGLVRAIVDVPFSFGTLTINSTVPNAFSERDISFFEELAEVLSEGFRRVEDLQQLALSEQRYRTLVETPNFVVMLLDGEGNYLYVSPQVETWLGYSPREFYRNADIHSKIMHPEDVSTAEFFYVVDRTSPSPMEFRWRHKDGRYLWASGSVFPIYENAEDEQVNKVSMIQVVVQDVTERKDAEERINASLEEKEVLLKEIHHRVKNNLQIISSLLHLQSEKVEDTTFLKAFDDSQHRIRSMALIHEELYESADLARIDFVGYVRRLTNHLFESFGIDQQRISLAIEIDGVLLTIDKAIPLGLIINELVSNSLKYGFGDSRKGRILIRLAASEEDDTFTLSVSDNGSGFPSDIDLENTDTLGLRLVNTLVGQLKARLELDHSEGTTFRIIRS